MRRLCLAILFALCAAPAALGAGPTPFAEQGGPGLVSSDGALRYVALPAGSRTVLEALATKDGQVRNFTTLDGSFGLPILTYGGPREGLTRDGKRLVLQTTAYGAPTSFDVLDTRNLQSVERIVLQGAFAYDALSPDGQTLYLIQHRSVSDLQHYVVRAYDLRTHRLLPGRIADRTQKSWVMQGFPTTRTTSADGRMVYTLYQNPGGYPFIHALDTVRGVAHCIGLPFSNPNQGALANVVLALHGKTLAVHWRSGRPWLTIDTTTWRVSPAHGSSFPWWTLAFAALPLAAVALLLRRRRRREEVAQEPRDVLVLPEREVVV